MSKKDLAVVILAAGKGTRMKSKLPKVLHEIAGRPMVGHVLDLAISLNPKEIITVIGPDMDELADFISSKSEIIVQKNQLGTADALKTALKKIKMSKGNIVILYADTPLIFENTLKNLVAKLDKVDFAVLGFRANDPTGYGRLITDEDNNLSKIIEEKEATNIVKKINLCNSGVIAGDLEKSRKYIGKIDNNNSKGEYYLTDIIKISVADGSKCGYCECQSREVIGVNNRIQLSVAENIFQQRLQHNAMLAGATLLDPGSVYFSYDTKLGKDVIIHPNVIFGPNVEIADNVEIKSFSHIEGAIIKSNVIIGPFARIRPGSQIDKEVKIGNFVEVKKSNIKQGAKINHLSYIGDSEIGPEANIGAGTITCNYDGKNKHKTKIGKKAFIGSNTALVAPVEIGDEALIGAGSTITKNVKKGALAVARGKQVVIDRR